MEKEKTKSEELGATPTLHRSQTTRPPPMQKILSRAFELFEETAKDEPLTARESINKNPIVHE